MLPLGVVWSDVWFHTWAGGRWAELPGTRRQLAPVPPAGGRLGSQGAGTLRGHSAKPGGPRVAWEWHLSCG